MRPVSTRLPLSLVLGVVLSATACTAALAAAPSIHTVSWKTVTLPGSVCEAKAPIHLQGGQAVVSSARWGRVSVSTEPPVFGDLSGSGQDVAALGVICSTAGGTAASQLAFARVVYGLTGSKLGVIGIVTPRHPVAKGVHVSLITAKVALGAVIATEYFYGPHDSDCCPSGRATTYWLYIHGGLTPQVPKVTKQPSS